MEPVKGLRPNGVAGRRPIVRRHYEKTATGHCTDIGIQLAIYTIIDPWLPVLGGDFGRVLIPVLSFVVSLAGLILCFKGESGS